MLLAHSLDVAPANSQMKTDASASGVSELPIRDSAMHIQITVAGQALTASLENNEAARDFAALLPLSVELEDYASTEKIAQLPKKISSVGAPAGMTPIVGDITYYAPWGNLAIFYKGFGYSNGLIKLGRIEGDIGLLRGRGPLQARFELAPGR